MDRLKKAEKADPKSSLARKLRKVDTDKLKNSKDLSQLMSDYEDLVTSLNPEGKDVSGASKSGGKDVADEDGLT